MRNQTDSYTTCIMRCRPLNCLHARKVSMYRTTFRLLPIALLAALTLSGCASSSGHLVASPRGLSFGNVAMGSSSKSDSDPYEFGHRTTQLPKLLRLEGVLRSRDRRSP